ncbi:type II toxin-antitoxin system RelE/ParE family toxin [Candidatus Palauibacter polyketidifaciens]|uniref:type II toxin-antitoxin system RelE family toxin n=1 Tax=Candidatus Palauibacter polyketidifaciens TaxID=3056740 RepID=UPI0023A0E423|nr:type II toxin-antitoxin system RelE/ParE family toxin [Candidatus Palauibacter polyketidifaciens]MDE2721708.1 type II toxin-antitoxin system RelE/ParE family toxin [Candidatus Palauibacter polyketidifaciens]
MARYEIEISRTAEKQLRKLPRADRERVAHRMSSLALDPYPRGTRKLAGYDDVFRLRVGRWRILYSVGTQTLIIIILKIGHRGDIYR